MRLCIPVISIDEGKNATLTFIMQKGLHTILNVTGFYQPAAREARGRLVLRLLCRFRVCIYVRPHLSRAQ